MIRVHDLPSAGRLNRLLNHTLSPDDRLEAQLLITILLGEFASEIARLQDSLISRLPLNSCSVQDGAPEQESES